MPQFFDVLAAIALVYALAYNVITDVYPAIGAWLWSVPLGLFGVFLFCLIGVPALKKQRMYAAAPLDGPMKVDIHTEERGRKHRLHINVVMSKRDQNALERSGLGPHVLFEHPDPKRPELTAQYHNIALLYTQTQYFDFPDIQSRDRAKEQLIEGLHALRTRLDQQRDEQVQAQTPGGTKETFEI